MCVYIYTLHALTNNIFSLPALLYTPPLNTNTQSLSLSLALALSLALSLPDAHTHQQQLHPPWHAVPKQVAIIIRHRVVGYFFLICFPPKSAL